jgi:dipeptidyl aminopeptidase/acylaminoacyl peptidase
MWQRLPSMVLSVAVATAATACYAARSPAGPGRPSTRPAHVLFAYVPAGSADGVLKVLDRRSGRFVERRPRTPGLLAAPVPSPDGAYLAVPDNTGRVALMSTVDGRTSWVATGREVKAVAWSADSRTLAGLAGRVGPKGAVVTVDVRSRTTSTVAVVPPGNGLLPTTALFGPDGKSLVVAYAGVGARAGSANRVAFYSAGGRLIRSIPAAGTPIGSHPWSPSGAELIVLGDPAREGGPPQILSVATSDGRVVGRFAVRGQPVGWLDESHVVVTKTQGSAGALESVKPDGSDARMLISLPSDVTVPATVFLAPAEGLPAGALRYAF